MSCLLALDLGCTKLIAAACDSQGTPLASVRLATDADRGGDDCVRRIADACATACDQAGLSLATAAALGVGCPGPLDRGAGMVLSPPQLPWGDYPIAARLSEQLGGIPVVIDNDCKAGGLGEFRFGAAAGASSMVYFGIGTGIGGCVIVDGQIWYGASDNANELGHLVVWMDGPPCGCGSHGCLEGIASGSGMERRARLAARQGEVPALLAAAGGDPDAIDGALIVSMADDDAGAGRIWRDAKVALAAGVASVMNALSPEVVVLGGGIVARHGEPLVREIEAGARARALGPNRAATRIVGAALGELSVLRGAGAMAFDLAHGA